MHLCLHLASRLNEIKATIESLNALSEEISNCEKIDEFIVIKERADKEILHEHSSFTKTQKELEGLKINFPEEFFNYLGIKDKDKEWFTFDSDDDGFLTKIDRKINKDSYFINFSNTSLDLSPCSHLQVASFLSTNLKSIIFPARILRIDISFCPNLPDILDLSNYPNLEVAELNDVKAKSIVFPMSIRKIRIGYCRNLPDTMDISIYPNIKEIDCIFNAVKSVLITQKQKDKNILINFQGKLIIHNP